MFTFFPSTLWRPSWIFKIATIFFLKLGNISASSHPRHRIWCLNIHFEVKESSGTRRLELRSIEWDGWCLSSGEQEHWACVQRANVHLLHTLNQGNFMKRLQDWEARKAQKATFRSLMNYRHREDNPLLCGASRNADLHLHLQAGEALAKLFVAMDRLKYNRLLQYT